MNPTDILTKVHWEDTDLVIMSRVRGVDAVNITQATLTSLDLYVYNRVTGDLIGTESLTISSVIHNTLQTGNGWDEDAVGYNFRYVVDGENFPTGDTTYRVEVVGTPLTGSTFLLAAVDVESQNRFSS